jgi:hypothetical protein
MNPIVEMSDVDMRIQFPLLASELAVSVANDA